MTAERPAGRDEDLLVERARAGDERAYGELVTRYRDLATRVAYVVAPGADTDDAVQEAFVKAWFALPRFRPGAAFRPWLCAIVANEARNRGRAAGRRQALSLRVSGLREPAPIQPEAVALQRADAERLVEAMSRLGADDRLVIAYRWLLGLGEAEMAEALGIARGTVKSRLSRAMTKLRTELVPEEGAR